MEFKKSQYLVMVAYYSRYIELAQLEHTTSEAVINHVKSILARHGIPETIISNNGPSSLPKSLHCSQSIMDSVMLQAVLDMRQPTEKLNGLFAQSKNCYMQQKIPI